jgi:hypothetical protein
MIDVLLAVEIGNVHRAAAKRLAEILFQEHPEGDASEACFEATEHAVKDSIADAVRAMGGDVKDIIMARALVGSEMRILYRDLVANRGTQH